MFLKEQLVCVLHSFMSKSPETTMLEHVFTLRRTLRTKHRCGTAISVVFGFTVELVTACLEGALTLADVIVMTCYQSEHVLSRTCGRLATTISAKMITDLTWCRLIFSK